jgi:hypothetical protein
MDICHPAPVKLSNLTTIGHGSEFNQQQQIIKRSCIQLAGEAGFSGVEASTAEPEIVAKDNKHLSRLPYAST